MKRIKFWPNCLTQEFELRGRKSDDYLGIIARKQTLFGDRNAGSRGIFEQLKQIMGAMGGDKFLSDGMFLWGREIGWLDDIRFAESLNLASPDAIESSVCWRTNILCWAASQAARVDGDYFEFGCYKGFSAFVIRHYCRKFFEERRNREYYWFDLFEDSINDKTVKLDHTSSELIAKKRASLFENIQIRKGNVLETYLTDSFFQARKVAFAHFDLNNFTTEFQILKQVMTCVSTGTVLVFDDFAMAPFRKQNSFYRRYFQKLSIPILELPTGQGIVIIP